jgi:hypothetical protein
MTRKIFLFVSFAVGSLESCLNLLKGPCITCREHALRVLVPRWPSCDAPRLTKPHSSEAERVEHSSARLPALLWGRFCLSDLHRRAAHAFRSHALRRGSLPLTRAPSLHVIRRATLKCVGKSKHVFLCGSNFKLYATCPPY